MMSRWAPVCTFYYSGRFYAALRDDDNTSSLCVTGNTSECNVFTQILHLDKSWWNITSWCRHKLAYTMLKIRNFAKNLQPPAQSWCRNLCCVQNETCCSSSVGERQADKQRERERSVFHCDFQPASVGLQGNEMKRSSLVTNPLIPPQLTLINHKEIQATSARRPARRQYSRLSRAQLCDRKESN